MTTVQHGSILIVDDLPTNLEVLSELLHQAGFSVFVAKSGETALRNVEKIQPELILLDIMMPGLNGYETCRQLKKNPKTQAIPVIFMSSLNEVIDKVKAFTVGGVDYITKPFQVEEVLARVSSQISLRLAQLKIEQFNQELENLIRHRTAQLETSNQALQKKIAQHRQSEKALLESEAQFRKIFELAPIGMAIIAVDGTFTQVNYALCQSLGYTASELLNQTCVDINHPDDRASAWEIHQHIVQGDRVNVQLETRYLAKTGKILDYIWQLVLVEDSTGKPLHLIGQYINITDHKRAEAKLSYSALHDALTQCPNRTFLMERLTLALKRTQRSPDYLFAVLFIDLDRFKVINDSLGHQVGDELLIAIAHLLQNLVRSTDIVSRLGGDEFVILLDPVTHLKEAIRIAKRIAQALEHPCELGDRQVFTTASIGIALSSVHYRTGIELLRDADIAMYRAKARGHAQYAVFNPEMYTQAFAKLQLENDLRHAIKQEAFLIYYQPIVDLQAHKVTGFEALIRWHHPQHGWISPEEFIPLAEETGLIIPLGEWVLRSACQQMADWQRLFPAMTPLCMNINLSVKQLSASNFLDRIDEILKNTGLNSQNLQLELTESILMENASTLTDYLTEFQNRKIQLSIDDFGTGYSSLSYLHRFPIDTLKIDRSFISRMRSQKESQQIVDTIINLAHHLGMTVIAEGVETSEQLQLLKNLTCEEAQGYFFSKPLPPDCVWDFMDKIEARLTA